MKNTEYLPYLKTRNLRLECLRLILCLWILLIHGSIIIKKYRKYLTRGFHVPTFFMLSFYFYYPSVYKRIMTRITTRFQRLLFPYFFWPIIALLLDHFLKKFTLSGLYDKKLSLRDYFVQILLGSQYYRIFYFHF